MGEITCLKTLTLFVVGKTRGCHLKELKELNLEGELHIENLHRVANQMDTKEANLVGKRNLRKLSLSWAFGGGFSLQGNVEEVLEALEPHPNLENLANVNIKRVVNPLNAKEANLIGKRNICRLYLSWKDDDGDLESPEDAEKVLEALEPHANLEHFVISGYKGVQFPFWMRNHILNNVVYLSLSDCHNCSHLPSLSLLASLRTLHLSRISRVMYIDDNFQGARAGIMRGFPSLQNLTIDDLPSLQRFSREDGRELLPCLISLNIFRCPKLTLPRLPSVTELHVSDCNEVLLGSISNLKSLTLLEVSKNNKLIDLPQCMLLNLTSLNQLYISYFSKLKCLPKELVGLSALETLDISCCDEFESFPEQGMEGLKSLKNLQLHECRKFTTLSEGLQLLSCLEKLTLTGCPELVALPDGIKYLNSLKHLEISGDHIKIESLSHNPCGFGPVYICPFNREEPIGSPKLAVLPEALRYVPALQSLYISGYPNLASLPHWLGDLTSLQTLLINYCPKLSSLPASIQGLTKLQKLAFLGCPELVKRCEKEMGEDCSRDMRSYWHVMTTMQLFSCPTQTKPIDKRRDIVTDGTRITVPVSGDGANQPELLLLNVISCNYRNSCTIRSVFDRKTSPQQISTTALYSHRVRFRWTHGGDDESVVSFANGKVYTAKGIKGVSAEFTQIYRSREVGQSYVTSVWTTLLATAHALWLMIRIRPQVVICNGPGTCIPLCMIAFLFKIMGIRWSSIFYVESIARVRRLSLSGLLLYKLHMADQFFVQWPQLQGKYPRAHYVGCLM
ncbi:hypothetical protein LWI28_026639 [Acer negundo]|uniref:R13L1/DRL21-like LRR repeat region domain-containing protein n=1 Tax=Acer negundo TaxID=4023 RepID=A0AAD5JSJ0_ACENE|nr:hypothetical protein LWI28_026639 [Acer negundo]